MLLEVGEPVDSATQAVNEYSVPSTQHAALCAEEDPTVGPHGEARRALLLGELHRAIELTQDNQSDPLACAIHVQALANLDASAAERVCAAAAVRHPLSAELNYLHAVLLMEQNRDEEAARAARRLLCLDRTLALAHFTLGSILRRQGDAGGAVRAFRNCCDLCRARPAEENVPLSDGETAGRLLLATEAQLHALAAVQEANP
jgi:chemotaxis protein methyltransferase CheR